MTLQQLINQAMFLIGALDSGQDATATESADLLRVLNQMMAMWAQEDKDLKFPPQDTLSDTYPLPLWTEEPVAYNLAVRAGPLFDLPVPPNVAVLADEGQRFIAKTIINNKVTSKDMTHLPAGGGRWNILTDTYG